MRIDYLAVLTRNESSVRVMSSLVSVNNLSKSYADVEAVRGIGFRVDRGQCFGLLGPNGAGKTTTLEMLEGIISPSGGEIHFRGAPRDHRFKQEIGIQFQSTSLQDFLTVRESLQLFAALYDKHVALETLVERCELGTFVDRDTRKLSGGQRQRLLLAIALVNDPTLLFLDEPTTGLDPQSRRNFWRLIESIRADGKTIILTTHYMEEAQRLCDQIAIMDDGCIIAEGPPKQLLGEHFPTSVIRLPRQALADVGRIPGAQPSGHGEIEIFTDDVTSTLAQLDSAGAPLHGLRIESPTLEDLFLKLTGHALRG